MRRLRDVLRLQASGLSKRRIAERLGISQTATCDCIRRASHAGLARPLSDAPFDAALEARLYLPPAATAKRRRPRHM